MAETAFDCWYREHHGALLATLAAVCGNVELARDAVDEACVRAFERWDRVSGMENRTGWAYRTALNVLRRRQRRNRLEELVLRRSGPVAAPAAREWLSVEVADALDALTHRQRTVVVLRYVADFRSIDIARLLGVAPGTVAATLHAARQRLAAELGDEETVASQEVVK